MKTFAALITLLTAMAFECWAVYPNGPSTEGTVDAATLWAWVKAHQTPANCTNPNAFADQRGGPMTVSLYQLGGVKSTTQPVFWNSNLDVDCDGSSSSLCFNDPSHQDMLSCGCDIANGGTIESAVFPFYVLPGCPSGCTDCGTGSSNGPFGYNTRGISLGQVGAIVNKLGTKFGIAYALFLDEDGCNTEIGEGSYALNNFLGYYPDPASGGSGNDSVAFVVFPGASNRVTDFDDTAAANAQAIAIGQTATAALLAGGGVLWPAKELRGVSVANCEIGKNVLSVKSGGSHSVSLFNLSGENVMSMKGMGAQTYNLSQLKSGTYIIRINLESGSFADKVVIY